MEYLKIAYLNCKGQSGFGIAKQLQIEQFLKFNDIDIINLQETRVDKETFSGCSFILGNYEVIKNNSSSEYGTCTLVKNTLDIENIILHESGRIIIFDIGQLTVANVYLPSGTDGESRASREKFCGEILPNMLTNSGPAGMIGGDWNNIIHKNDCTHNQQTKISPCLKRLVSTFSWVDSYRFLYPQKLCYSRYYKTSRYFGASRIDRSYFWGALNVIEANYVSIAFSDHMAYIVKTTLPETLKVVSGPKYRPIFKIKEAVVKDEVFKSRLKKCMKEWEEVKSYGIPVLSWWELLVKPGIRKIAIERTKEINRDRRKRLNLLMLHQSFLTSKVHAGEHEKLTALRQTQIEIENWFELEVERVKHQSNIDDVQISEKTRIYHHELHKKHYKRSSILKLKVGNVLLKGHSECAQHLEQLAANILENPANLNQAAQQTLLNEIEVCFTEKDNIMLNKEPSKNEVKASVMSSNAKASPGNDGLSNLFYQECFDIVGDALTGVVKAVHNGEAPTISQRTSLMVFSSKPNKAQSLLARDKRRLSMLNSDFKVITGLMLLRYNKLLTHTLCPQQLAVGDDRKISFGICQARDAIQACSKSKLSSGIADTDFEAAFDYLCLDWVKQVLEKKGLSQENLNRFSNVYNGGITLPVINNVIGKPIRNKRLSLRQGDRPSGVWFCFGIDPLLLYLQKYLKGILVHSTPVMGPSGLGLEYPLPPLETRYKVIGYLDDCKPAITSMEEFLLLDKACTMFEQSSGCKMHRDPATQKCKFLPLGKWKRILKQEDIPLPYLQLTDSLDYLGCKLFSSYHATKNENGIMLVKKINDLIGSWKSGKFLPLTSRPWSLNSFCLSKIWYRLGCLEVKAGDLDKIVSSMKSWLYQDSILKPPENVLYRAPQDGGLGLHHTKTRAQALLIHTFLCQAISPRYSRNNYLYSLYRWHVLQDRDMKNPGRPPYYSESFFSLIRSVKDTTNLCLPWISVKQWSKLLLERGVTHVSYPDSPPELIPTKLEQLHPQYSFESSYRLMRLFGLTPDKKSFLFRMMHNILPNKERLHRIKKAATPYCVFCPDLHIDNIEHLFNCPKYSHITVPLIEALGSALPEATVYDIATLRLPLQESNELPVVWLLSTTLMHVWNARKEGKVLTTVSFKADVQADLNVLKATKWRHYALHNSALLLERMLEHHFWNHDNS